MASDFSCNVICKNIFDTSVFSRFLLSRCFYLFNRLIFVELDRSNFALPCFFFFYLFAFVKFLEIVTSCFIYLKRWFVSVLKVSCNIVLGTSGIDADLGKNKLFLRETGTLWQFRSNVLQAFSCRPKESSSM